MRSLETTGSASECKDLNSFLPSLEVITLQMNIHVSDVLSIISFISLVEILSEFFIW